MNLFDKYEYDTKIKLKNFEKFIDALFNNDGKLSLKDRDKAALEASIPAGESMEYFKLLTTIKGSTGFPLIEFRKNTSQWHPNYTSEVIKEILRKGGFLNEFEVK